MALKHKIEYLSDAGTTENGNYFRLSSAAVLSIIRGVGNLLVPTVAKEINNEMTIKIIWAT